MTTMDPGQAVFSAEWIEGLARYVFSQVNVFAPGSRLHPQNFLSFLLVGCLAFEQLRRRGVDVGSSPISYVFPRATYFSPSSFMDLKVFLAFSFIVLDKVGIRILATAAVSTWVSSTILQVTGPPTPVVLEGWRWGLCALLVAMAYDFGGYWLHRVSHESRVLWPFHKVHHSAEVLTPLTVVRIHPMNRFFASLFIPLTVGPIAGAIHATFGHQDALAMTAIGASYAFFNFVGGNLRHSHIWFGYGPFLSRIMCSPAMHQIHHSVDPKHWNTNYAENFSLWDWMFGSLYVPDEEEKLVFGLSVGEDGKVVQPHPTLRAALVEPYLESGRELRSLVTGVLGARGERSAAGER